MKSLLMIFVLGAATCLAAESVTSGPQVGSKVPGQFEPFNVTGPNAGEEFCLYCKFGNAPVVMIFAREPHAALAKLLHKVDDLAEKHKKVELAACAIFCTKDAKIRPALQRAAANEALRHVILATMEPAGPEGYEIAKDADVTVLLYVGGGVKANHAFRKGELDDKAIERILADVPKVLPAR